ncbi:hypothetical protein ACFVYA_39780 [Amycolatopsis sp. NPDC058278]|uniref:hypothetical protein n=1 Tax=Amycolatopsis sp. NPDC058278 TaxID=3346417 RepID=UPI0036D773FD
MDLPTALSPAICYLSLGHNMKIIDQEYGNEERLTMYRRLTSIAAATTAFAGALILGTASPAQASAATCVTYLEGVGEQTTARNVICESTEALSDNVSPQYAYSVCLLSMTATGLTQSRSAAACSRAIE